MAGEGDAVRSLPGRADPPPANHAWVPGKGRLRWCYSIMASGLPGSGFRGWQLPEGAVS